MSDSAAELAQRLDRIEAQLAIQQLPARYALAALISTTRAKTARSLGSRLIG